MSVTVRQRLDQLLAEPPVTDLGYPADQRVVAAALLGLQLLADAIDQIEDRLRAAGPVDGVPELATLPVGIDGITADIEGLTTQVGVLAQLIKRAAEDS